MGITYAIPLTLGNVLKGDIPKSEVQSRFIYVLAKPLNVSVPVLRGNAGNVTHCMKQIGVLRWMHGHWKLGYVWMVIV